MAQNENSNYKVILNKANIVEIISSYIKLESHGKNYFGICPFHDDHSPSMSVSSEKQVYKCFVCGVSGNAITFVQNYLGVTFHEAVKIVADKIGAKYEYRESKEAKVNAKYYDIMELSTMFYENNLRTKDGEEARAYLNARGITDSIIKEFSIGLALKDRTALYDILSKKKIPVKDMNELGLIASKDDEIYDLFRNRIIFPLKSPTGKVNGFSGRIYNTSSNSKYVNTKETVIFKKRENLYNYHLAAPASKQEKSIIICEGFMDAIRIYSSGIKNVVATMGTALAKEQVDLLKRLDVTVIIVMDNDSAGELATINIGQVLMKEGIDTKVVRLTGKKDPDEYILEYGVLAFKDNLKNPLDYIEFMEIVLKRNKNLQNPTHLTNYINEMINLVNNINNDILSEVTINKLADEFHLDKNLIASRINISKELEEVKPEEVQIKQVTSKKNNGKYESASRKLIYSMMNNEDALRLGMRETNLFDDDKYGLIYKNLIYYFELNREISLEDYLVFIDDYPDIEPLVKDIAQNEEETDFNHEYIEFLISTIKKIKTENRIKELQVQIKNELDFSKKKKLCEEILEIKKGCV